MQDQAERIDAARRAFGLVATAMGNRCRYLVGNDGDREMTITSGEDAQNPAYRRELHFFLMPTSFSSGARGAAQLGKRALPLALLLGALHQPASAQINARLQLRVWQRVVSERKQTMQRFETGKPGSTFTQITRQNSQVKAVLELSNPTSTAYDAIRWKATLRGLSFFDDDGVPPLPSDWPLAMRREQQAHRTAVTSEIQFLADRLAGTTLEITQAKDGEITGVGISNLLHNAHAALQRTPAKLRGEVESHFAPLLFTNQWRSLLSAQSPHYPASREVGKQWAYSPLPLVSLANANGGTSRIETVQGEGEGAQINVVSTASIDFAPKPRLEANTSEYALEIHSIIQAQTRFGERFVWPLEQHATERGHMIFRIYIVDKQGHSGVVDATPSDYEMQSRLICEPAKP